MLDKIDYCDKLPEEASFSTDTGLFWKEQYICPFVPCVINKVEIESDGKTESFAKLCFLFTDGSDSDLITVPLCGLENISWYDLNQKCILNPDCTRAGKYIAYIIRYTLTIAPVERKYFINKLGLHIVNNLPVFNIGDLLIKPPNMDTKINIVMEPLPHKLAFDIDRYSEHQAVIGMMEVVNLSTEAGRVIFAHSLLSVMRAVYVDVGVTPRCIVFLVGKTGNKKTTYSVFQTQLYDRDKGMEHPIRLNASILAAEAILYEKSDCSVVLDDLFPAKSSEVKRKQEAVLIELTRIVGDNSGRARMNGKQVVARQPRCGVIVTGEYLIGTGSDAARLLPVEFSTPIDPVRLHKCQSEPLVISTFYYYLITWYTTNYYEIKNLLTKWLPDFRKVDLGVHSRLQETFFCLTTSYKLFLQFCTEKGFTSSENARIQYHSFQDLIIKLVKKQNGRVMQNEDSKSKKDYFELIRKLYINGNFSLADSANQLKEKHDGLLYKDFLCLRGAKLLDKIHKYVPTARLDDVVNELLAKNALKQGREKNSIQISGGNGKRFYAIPLIMLQ